MPRSHQERLAHAESEEQKAPAGSVQGQGRSALSPRAPAETPSRDGAAWSREALGAARSPALGRQFWGLDRPQSGERENSSLTLPNRPMLARGRSCDRTRVRVRVTPLVHAGNPGRLRSAGWPLGDVSHCSGAYRPRTSLCTCPASVSFTPHLPWGRAGPCLRGTAGDRGAERLRDGARVTQSLWQSRESNPGSRARVVGDIAAGHPGSSALSHFTFAQCQRAAWSQPRAEPSFQSP